MNPALIVLIVIAVVLVVAFIVLTILGKKAQKRKEEQDEIRAEVKYALDVNYEFVGDCHINIAVKKKGAAVKIA